MCCNVEDVGSTAHWTRAEEASEGWDQIRHQSCRSVGSRASRTHGQGGKAKTVGRDGLGTLEIAHLLEQAARFLGIIGVCRSVGVIANHPRPGEWSAG